MPHCERSITITCKDFRQNCEISLPKQPESLAFLASPILGS